MQKTKEICGNSIVLHPLNTDNREEYLKVFKRASAFSKLYAASEDLWRTMSESIGTDNDTTVRYIISIPFTKVNVTDEEGINTLDERENTPDGAKNTPDEWKITLDETKNTPDECMDRRRNSAEYILDFCVTPRSVLEIAELLGYKEKESARRSIDGGVAKNRNTCLMNIN